MNQKSNNNKLGSLMDPVPNESVVDQIITRITDAIISVNYNRDRRYRRKTHFLKP